MYFSTFTCRNSLDKFDLENLGQGHTVQRSPWSHSLANTNLYQSRTWAFFASSGRFPDLISKFVNLKNADQDHDVQHSQWQIYHFLFDSHSNVCSISHHLRDVRKYDKMLKHWPIKCQSQEGEKRDSRLSTGNVQLVNC